MSGKYKRIQSDLLCKSIIEGKVSSSRCHYYCSPSAKRRRFSEGCKSVIEDNMASQAQNTESSEPLSTPSSSSSASPAPEPSGNVSILPSSSTPAQSVSPSLLSPSTVSSQGLQIRQQKSNNFEPLDKTSSNTLKRNPKMELSKTDLLKLLGYLEGELQARDIVIAALKSEKMKHLLSSRARSGTTDPHAALARDVAIVGGVVRKENNQSNRHLEILEELKAKHLFMKFRMSKALNDTELQHRAVVKELEEEKRKHEHDTAQGDDITYGLEKERTRLKKELELERQEKKRLEMELKKESMALEMEKSRQKQIVLLLLAERKKIIMKYIEERKRSEDLAQILSEEKVRIDSMAEGLEEESKKSLQMEAELEKQQAQFDMERQQYRQALAKAEKRSKELEDNIEVLKSEIESWKGGVTMRGTVRAPLGVTPPPPPAKPANLAAMPTLRPVANAIQVLKGPAVLGTGTPMVSSKVVQPTATVSSVPVSGPTTGIARSVTPRQVMRGVTYGSATPVTPITSSSTFATATHTNTNVTTIGTVSTTSPATVPNINANVPPPSISAPESAASEPQTTDKRSLTPVGGLASSPAPGTPSSASSPIAAASIPSGIKPTYYAPAAAGQLTGTKKPLIPRGVPPPVPPNKPVVPPKKEAAVYMRRADHANAMQDTLKINKTSGTCQIAASAASPVIQQSGQTSPGLVASHHIVEEAKPR